MSLLRSYLVLVKASAPHQLTTILPILAYPNGYVLPSGRLNFFFRVEGGSQRWENDEDLIDLISLLKKVGRKVEENIINFI